MLPVLPGGYCPFMYTTHLKRNTMKRITHVHPSTKTIDLALLVLRMGIAALMLTHGLPKLMSLTSGEPVAFLSVWGMSPALSLSLVVFAEVACSILLLVGFVTRLAVVPLIITMLVAVFSIHAADPFAKQELGVLYLLVYAGLLLAGSGRYSVDGLLQRKQRAYVSQGPAVQRRYPRPEVG
jgi:putative oxidoreductase